MTHDARLMTVYDAAAQSWREVAQRELFMRQAEFARVQDFYNSDEGTSFLEQYCEASLWADLQANLRYVVDEAVLALAYSDSCTAKLLRILNDFWDHQPPRSETVRRVVANLAALVAGELALGPMASTHWYQYPNALQLIAALQDESVVAGLSIRSKLSLSAMELDILLRRGAAPTSIAGLVSSYLQAIATDKSRADPYFARVVYHWLKQSTEASGDRSTAVTLCVGALDSAMMLIDLAQTCVDEGQEETGMTAARRALEISPYNSEIVEAAVTFMLNSKHCSEGYQVALRALAGSPGDESLLYNTGFAAVCAFEVGRAVEHFQTWSRLLRGDDPAVASGRSVWVPEMAKGLARKPIIDAGEEPADNWARVYRAVARARWDGDDGPWVDLALVTRELILSSSSRDRLVGAVYAATCSVRQGTDVETASARLAQHCLDLAVPPSTRCPEMPAIIFCLMTEAPGPLRESWKDIVELRSFYKLAATSE